MPASLAVPKLSLFESPASMGGNARSQHVNSLATFEIFRTERVSLTSMLFSGDDWRWRFRSAAGSILVNSEGYSSEAACRAAILALQNNAGAATIALRDQY